MSEDEIPFLLFNDVPKRTRLFLSLQFVLPCGGVHGTFLARVYGLEAAVKPALISRGPYPRVP